MSAHLFRYSTDHTHGRVAHPIAGAHADLGRFLTEEVTSTDYADLLADCVTESKRTGKAVVNTGNAYATTLGPDPVTIEHLHVKGHAAVHVTLAVFEQALAEWRDFISKP